MRAVPSSGAEVSRMISYRSGRPPMLISLHHHHILLHCVRHACFIPERLSRQARSVCLLAVEKSTGKLLASMLAALLPGLLPVQQTVACYQGEKNYISGNGLRSLSQKPYWQHSKCLLRRYSWNVLQ